MNKEKIILRFTIHIHKEVLGLGVGSLVLRAKQQQSIFIKIAKNIFGFLKCTGTTHSYPGTRLHFPRGAPFSTHVGMYTCTCTTDVWYRGMWFIRLFFSTALPNPFSFVHHLI